MSVWASIGDFVSRIAGAAFSTVMDAVNAFCGGDAELRRQVAFSVAMIALSAKIAKADGVVTYDEVRAFREIFTVPVEEARNVERLYNLAQQDVAGFEAYAERVAKLCGSGRRNCPVLEDVLDGLFHIATADHVIHEGELRYLRRVAEIFEVDEAHFDTILARHAVLGKDDPYAVLGVGRGTPADEIKRRYRELVVENHPDRMIARGLPPEFIAIATSRLAAINDAYALIERGFARA